MVISLGKSVALAFFFSILTLLTVTPTPIEGSPFSTSSRAQLN
jgi:hypothetical protein